MATVCFLSALVIVSGVHLYHSSLQNGNENANSVSMNGDGTLISNAEISPPPENNGDTCLILEVGISYVVLDNRMPALQSSFSSSSQVSPPTTNQGTEILSTTVSPESQVEPLVRVF